METEDGGIMAMKQFEPSGLRLKPLLLRETDAGSSSPGSNFACKVSVSLKYSRKVGGSSF